MRLVISPDNQARLAAAAAWLNTYPADAELLVLGPTREAVHDFVRVFVNHKARFGLYRLTLNQVAGILSAPVLASRNLAPASNLSVIATAARAVHLLLSENAFSYFKPVANKPGFPTAIARTVQELRMNGAPLKALGDLERGGKDLTRLVDRIGAELDRAHLADRAAIFHAAIENLKTLGAAPRWVGLPLLMLDLPVTTALETELIAALVSTTRELFATAAQGDSRTIRNLEQSVGCKAERLESLEDTSLVKMRLHLFEDSSPKPVSLDETVKLRSWPGEARECVEIARTIQAEVERGVPFDRIAVFLRSAAEYRPHIEEAFRRAAIPAYFARSTTRPDPAGRALLALLACRAEDYSARRFAEYVSLAQVPDPDQKPDADEVWVPPETDFIPENASGGIAEFLDDEPPLMPIDIETRAAIEGSVRAPWRWEQLLVESSVIGGRDRWARRLAGLETELKLKRKELSQEEEARAAVLDSQLADIAHLTEFALPLIDELAALPVRAAWGEWLDHLRRLATSALRNPENVLETLAELAPMSPVGDVDLYEVQLVLGQRLRELTVPPPRRRYGAVFIGPTDAARGMSFDVVFVPGLAEKLFPRKVSEDPILPDEKRRAIDRDGVVRDLIIQRDRIEAERLALRLAIGAAATRVHLSYPRIDVQQSRRRVPSFYGLEALRAAEGELPGFHEFGERAESGSRARLGWPAPSRADEAIDEAEYDLALLARLIDADPETTTGTAHYLLGANHHLARALRSRSRRWLKRWTSYDGLVEPDELAREALSRHQLSARSFSPTALQNFSACPYRFFLQAVHRLQPRMEPAAIEVIDPLTRGSLFHKVQYEVLTLLREAEMLPLTSDSVQGAIELVDDVLDRVAAVYEDQLAPAIPKVWEDGINAIRADLREWLRRHSESQDGWVPHKFELSFGLADRDREEEDPASVPDPVPIIGELKLRGSIDLVERSSNGKLRATDHKTGKARAGKNVVIGGGQHLQPVLYALACEKLLGGSVESGRLYYCTADGGFEERVVPLDDYARGYAGIVIDTIGASLAEGFLPAAPDEDMCRWCDYLAVCGPNEERRVQGKPQQRLHDLKTLRELP